MEQKQALPERKIGSIEEFLAKFADVQEVVVGDVERPVQRPQDADQQKEHQNPRIRRCGGNRRNV